MLLLLLVEDEDEDIGEADVQAHICIACISKVRSDRHRQAPRCRTRYSHAIPGPSDMCGAAAPKLLVPAAKSSTIVPTRHFVHIDRSGLGKTRALDKQAWDESADRWVMRRRQTRDLDVLPKTSLGWRARCYFGEHRLRQDAWTICGPWAANHFDLCLPRPPFSLPSSGPQDSRLPRSTTLFFLFTSSGSRMNRGMAHPAACLPLYRQIMIPVASCEAAERSPKPVGATAALPAVLLHLRPVSCEIITRLIVASDNTLPIRPARASNRSALSHP